MRLRAHSSGLGAEDQYVTVMMNIAFALGQHLTSSPCHTDKSDIRLHVAANSYFYPDLLVARSALGAASPLIEL